MSNRRTMTRATARAETHTKEGKERVTKLELHRALDNARISAEARESVLHETVAAYDRTIKELASERFANSELRRELSGLRTRLAEIHEHAVNTVLGIQTSPFGKLDGLPSLRSTG